MPVLGMRRILVRKVYTKECSGCDHVIPDDEDYCEDCLKKISIDGIFRSGITNKYKRD